MPFPMKIQPIDSSFSSSEGGGVLSSKPVVKSRFKRLFERQFPNVLRISSTATTEKISASVVGELKDSSSNNNGDFEPSSLCLAKMVQSFIEESSTEKQTSTKCGRRRCNCFNGNCNDSSDDEFDDSGSDAFDVLKSLVACVSIGERNLLADTSKIVEMNKNCKRKEDYRKNVTDGLLALGYDAGICKSRWEKACSYPAGEYEYMDVMVDGERLIVDIDFRSEFEIARSTGNYKGVLQFLPSIFVGKADRLQQIVSIVSEAAKLSLKKKGMHFPPWRKAEYMRAKWLSAYIRTSSSSSSSSSNTQIPTESTTVPEIENKKSSDGEIFENKKSSDDSDFSSEFELIFGEIKNSPPPPPPPPPKTESFSMSLLSSSVGSNSNGGVEKKFSIGGVGSSSSSSPWMPPAIKPKSTTSQRGSKIVTGLASVLKEKP